MQGWGCGGVGGDCCKRVQKLERQMCGDDGGAYEWSVPFSRGEGESGLVGLCLSQSVSQSLCFVRSDPFIPAQCFWLGPMPAANVSECIRLALHAPRPALLPVGV